MRIQRVLSLGVITVCILIVSTLGNPRPDYFDRKTNPDLSQWAEQHQDQVYEMANRLRTEYNLAVTQHSDQNLPGETTGCKTTCIPSTTWVSHTGKTQDEINQIAKEMTTKLVNDLNSGKISYNQITQPNWFENYAANEIHLLQNQHYQNNFGAQIHIPQGSYYHKSEKKEVYEYTQGGGNIQPTYIYKPSVTTFEEKKQETQEHSSSGYPTVYYGHGETIEKTEKLQDERKDTETIARVPIYTDSYFHATDRKGRKKVNRRPTAAPAIHVSYGNQEENAYVHSVPVSVTTVPVTVTHKEQHIANVEKQQIPIIYKYGNNERRTEQTQHRNRTTPSTTYRRPSTSITSRRNTTTTHVETQTQQRKPTVYSESKHSIYKHLKTDDGEVPNYKPRVVHKESKVGDYYGFGAEAETSDSYQIQNHTVSTKHQQKHDQSQINYRPAYVGHQSRYNRTHGYNYTRPGYVLPGGTSQISQTSQTAQKSHQGSPNYAIIGGGQNSQTSQSTQTSQAQQTRPGYVVVGGVGNSQVDSSSKITETVQHTRPGYVVIGGAQQLSETSQSSISGQQTSRPGYIVTGGGGSGSKIIQTSYTNHTTKEARPGYIIRPGTKSNQVSQTSHTSQQNTRPGYVISGGGSSHVVDSSHTSQTSQHGTRPGYILTGGGGSQTIETSHISQTTQQGGRPGYVVVTGGGGSQTVETSHTSQTSQHGTRPGYIITEGGGSQTVEATHSSQTSQQGRRPGYIVVTGGGGQTVETSHTSQTSQQDTRPGYIVTGSGGSQTIETSYSNQTSQQSGRPGYIIAGGGAAQTIESSHSSQTSQHGGRPGYIITGGGGSQTMETSHSSQTSQQAGRPGYVVVAGGGESQTMETSHSSQTSQQGGRPGYIITGGGGSQTIETSHSSQTSQQGGRPGYAVVTGGGGSQTVESSHTSQTSQQGTRPGFIITGGGGSQTMETSYSNQTSQQTGRPGYVVTGGGGTQTIESSHASQISQQGGRPGYVVVTGGGGSQTVETSHTSQASQQSTRPGYVITGGGGSQTVESSHSSQTSQQGGRPGYVVVGGSQTIESSHINEISHEEKQPEFIVTGLGNSQVIETAHSSETIEQNKRPGYVVITNGGESQTVVSSHYNQSSQQSGRPGYVVVAGGGESHTVESNLQHQITQGTRPGYVITGGGAQTIESSHINQTSESNRPGYIITSGENSQTSQSTHTTQTGQHTRPGYVITGGGSQTVEITHSNQSSQQTTQPGYVIAGGGSQTNQISQINQTSQQTSKPGFIVTSGGSQTVESTYSNQTAEQSSRPGYIITGGGGSQTTHTSQTSHSGKETGSGYIVIGGEGQLSHISQTNQTSEHLSQPGYIITGGGGSQTIETSQINQNTQENRPGYVVTGEDSSQTSHISQSSNQSLIQGTPGYIAVGGGSYQNYTQEFISQLNQTGGSVHIANGSYVSGLGFNEIETNWTTTTTNKKPHVIISKDRGDQPPNQFEDYYDSEEYVEKEPGIGFYPIGLKPEIGLLVTGRPPTVTPQSQLNIHGSHGSHSSQSHTSHHTQKNHQSHLYPGSKITTTHGHHTHTIGTLPGDSKPFLEDHHVDKALVEESSHNIHNSQNYIRDNELRGSYGFNKSKHHHESDEHRHSGIRHGQNQHSYSTQQHHTGSQQHAHRHHHGDRQTGKSEFFIITRNGRRQNVSRHEHEEMLKSQISLLIENFARTVERDIQSIHPDEDKETVQVEIVSDNMEQLLLDIKKLIGDDPDTKQMVEQLFNEDLETYQKKYRVKRSFLNLGLGRQTSESTASSQTASSNNRMHIGADLETGLFNQELLSGRVGQLPSFGFSGNLNSSSYHIGRNTYNPYHVAQTHNTLDTQSSYDLTQQTQTEDFSQFSLGLTTQSAKANAPALNSDSEQKYLEDFSMFQLINKPGSINTPYAYDNQQILKEDLTQFFHNHEQSQNLNTPKHLTPVYSTNSINQGAYVPTNQPRVPATPTPIFKQYGNKILEGNTRAPGTCCWKPGNPNYQPIGSKMNLTGIIVGPVSRNTDLVIPISPIYKAIDTPITESQTENVTLQPCQKTPATQINPMYTPIELLPQKISFEKQLPNGNEQPKSLKQQDLIYKSQYSSEPLILNLTGQSGEVQSKPVVDPIYKPGTSQSTDSDDRLTDDFQQSSYPIYTEQPLPSNVQQSGSSGYPHESIYQSHYIPKQPITKPTDQTGRVQSKPVVDPIYKSSAPQPTDSDEQLTVDFQQSSYPTYTEQQLPSHVQQSGSPGYPHGSIYQSNYIPKQPTTKPTNQTGGVQSKPVVDPIYKPGTSQPTGTDKQLTDDLPQSSYPTYTEQQLPSNVQHTGSPGYPHGSIYQSHYIPKQPITKPTDQTGGVQSNPVVDPIYKPSASQPTDSDEQLTDEVQQSSYPTYTEQQLPSNVQHSGSPGYPHGSIYQSHYIPKQPTTKLTNQTGGVQSKPVVDPIYKPGTSQPTDSIEQLTDDVLQSSYPLYTEQQLPSNVQQSGSPGYPHRSIYQSHYIPKQPITKPMDQTGGVQSKPVVDPIYKPSAPQPTDSDEQLTDDVLQSSYPIYTEQQLPSNVQQSGSPGYPHESIYQSHYMPKQPITKPTDQTGGVQSKPVVDPIYKPSAPQPTDSDEQLTDDVQQSSYPTYTEQQLPSNVQQSGSPGHPHGSIYQSHYIPEQPTTKSTNQTGAVQSKPVVDPIYKPGTSQPTDSIEQLTDDVLQSSYPIYTEQQLPNNVQQSGSPGYPHGSIYQSHYIPKQPITKPMDQTGRVQSKPVVDPIYKPSAPQPTDSVEQLTDDVLQSSYPTYTEKQLPSNVQHSGSPGYPHGSIYQSHYIPKQPTTKLTNQTGGVQSKPVVDPIYKPGTSQPTDSIEQLTDDVLQSSYPIYTEQQLPSNVQQSGSPGYPHGSIYQSHYIPKQPTTKPTDQTGRVQSKPVVDPIYKPGTSQPTDPDEQLTDVLQSSYPIYTEQQLPSNVQHSGSPGYPHGSIYQSHYIPKQPTTKLTNQTGGVQSKPVVDPIYKPGTSQPTDSIEQLTDDVLQSSYPIYTEQQLPTNVQQSGRPGYPHGSIYQSHYIPKQPIHKPTDQTGGVQSKPVVDPIHKPSAPQPTDSVEQLTDDVQQSSYPTYTEKQLPSNVQHSGSPGYPHGSIYQSHYIPKQPTTKLTNQTGGVQSKPVVDPIYKPGTSQPTDSIEQLTDDVLQSSYPIYTEQQLPSNVQHSGSPGYPHGSIYQSHYIPKQPTTKPTDQTGRVQSKPVVDPIYKPGTSQPTDPDEQLTDVLQSSYPIYTEQQLPSIVQQSGSPGYPHESIYQSHYMPTQPITKPTYQTGGVQSKPVVDPIYKPSAPQPTDSVEQFTDDVLQSSYPIYTEQQLPSNVQQSGRPGYPHGSIYQSHYIPKQPIHKPTDQTGGVQSKPVVNPIYKPSAPKPTDSDEQLTDEVLQSSYPIYTKQLPSNVQYSGSPGYPQGSIYQSNYIPKQPTTKPTNQTGGMQSKPVVDPIYKPGTSQPTDSIEQLTDDVLQSSYPIYTEQQLPSNVQQSGSPGYPHGSIYQSHYIPKQPITKPMDQTGRVQPKPVVDPIYKPSAPQPTDSDEQLTDDVQQSSYPIYTEQQLPSNVQHSGSPGYPHGSIYQSHYIPKQPTTKPTNQTGGVQSKPVVDPIYKPGTSQPTDSIEQLTDDVLQSSYPIYTEQQLPSNVQQSGSPGYPHESIYQSHYIPKQPITKPTDQTGGVQFKPVVDPIYKPSAPQPTVSDEQLTDDVQQSSYPTYPIYKPSAPQPTDSVEQFTDDVLQSSYPIYTEQQLPSNVQQSGRPRYPHGSIYQSHYIPKQPINKPTDQTGGVQSKPVVNPIYKPSAPKPTDSDEQLTDEVLQSSYPIYTEQLPSNVQYSGSPGYPQGSIYQSNYIPKQPTTKPTNQTGGVQSKPVVDPIYKPGTSQPTDSIEQLTDDVLQSSYPIYTEQQLPSNVQQSGSPGYPQRSIYQSHYIPKQPTTKPTDQTGGVQSKPVVDPIYKPGTSQPTDADEQLTDEVQQSSYPIYTEQQLPSNVQQSGSPGYPHGSIYQSHYIPKQPITKPTNQTGGVQSKPVVDPIYKPSAPQPTDSDEQLTDEVEQINHPTYTEKQLPSNVQHSGSSGYPHGSIYQSHYIPKQPTTKLTNQTGGVQSKSVVDSIYKPGTSQPTDPDEQMTDVLQSSYPIYTEQKLPSNVQQSGSPGYSHESIYQSHYMPKQPFSKPTYQTGGVQSKPVVDPIYKPSAPQPTDSVEQLTDDVLQSSYPIYTEQQLPSNVQHSGSPGYPHESIYQSHYMPKQPTTANQGYPHSLLYQSHYIPKQPTTKPKDQSVIPSKPDLDLGYKPGSLQPSNSDQQFALDGLLYPIFKEEKIPSNVQQSVNNNRRDHYATSFRNSQPNLGAQYFSESDESTYKYELHANQHAKIKYRPSDVSHVPVRHMFYPRSNVQPNYNLHNGKQQLNKLTHLSLQKEQKHQNSDQRSQQKLETLTQHSLEDNQKKNQDIDKKPHPQLGLGVYPLQQNQFAFLYARPGNISYAPVRRTFYSYQNINPKTTSNVLSSQITRQREFKNQTTETLTQENHQRKSNTSIIPTMEHSQKQEQIQINQYTDQNTLTNKQSTVQQNTQFNIQPVNPLSGLTNIVQQHRQGSLPFRGEMNKSEQINTTNTQQISTQYSKPIVSHNDRRGDQTSFDNADYSDTYDETKIITNPVQYDEDTQDTTLTQKQEYMQYTDIPDAELQQLTQKITKEDFTNFVKSP